MNDDQGTNQNSGGYVSSGFTFGGDAASSGSQATPPTPPAAPAAPNPPTPPAPPAPPAPPIPPMAGLMGDQSAAAVQPQGDPNYKFGERMKTFKTTIKLPAHKLAFDEDKFLNLLAGSISLTKDEKKKIVDSIPKLRQDQVDELMKIFEEEREKFIELSTKHSAQLKKLEDQHAADWKDLEIEFKAAVKSSEDVSKAEEIRKQLGL